MSIELAMSFRAWRKFHARGLDSYHDFLVVLARESKSAFIQGMRSGKSGIHYPRYPNRSSAAGEYPAVQSGALRNSIQTRVRGTSMTIGTNTPYSDFLRYGTSRMAARKMSDDALEEGIARVRAKFDLSAEWVRG